MDGIINILKPPGISSNGVVNVLRRLFDIKKIGHSGTLDPEAAGVLPIYICKATRLIEFASETNKEYIGEISFGCETDTQDAQGIAINSSEIKISEDQAKRLFFEMTGEIVQETPKYSAVKVAGQPMYRLTRKGIEVPQKLRNAVIYSSEIISKTNDNSFLFRVTCSRGTYIRTLCRDIGKKSGACAHMSFLLRTGSGRFKIENSYTLDEIKTAYEKGCIYDFVLPLEYAVCGLPRIDVDAVCAERLINGVKILTEHKEVDAAAVYNKNALLAIVHVKDGMIIPKKVIGALQ